MPRTARPPKYRRHKGKGLAVVTLGGRDVYLGPYDSPESWAKYHRLVADHLAGRPPELPPPRGQVAAPASAEDLTVAQMIGGYRRFATQHYTRNGRVSKELADMKYAARPLVKLFGPTPAAKFGPLALKRVRTHMIEAEDLSRGVVNARINRIKRIFKWAVSEELVPPSVYEGLRAVAGLRRNQSDARETDPVRPALREWVEPVLPLVGRQVAAMIELQWLTGMRPGEVVRMRPADLKRSDDVWEFEPHEHKNDWRGHARVVPLGPKAQQILRPFLDRPAGSYLFSPREAEAERSVLRRSGRRTPMTPSQAARRPKASSPRAKRERYDVDSYRQAVQYGIVKANRGRSAEEAIPVWCPLQLRHSGGTAIRERFGVEAAQVTLGHSRIDVTQVYAERSLRKAKNVARRMG